MKKILIYALLTISSCSNLYSQEVQEKVELKKFELLRHLPSEVQLEVACSIIANSENLEQSIREFLNLLSINGSLNGLLNNPDSKKLIKEALLKYINKDPINRFRLKDLIIKVLKQNKFKLANLLLLLNSEHNIIEYFDINDLNNTQNNILTTVTKNNHIEIVKLLLAHDQISTYDKGNALIAASKNNHIEIVKLLLTHNKISTYDKGNALIAASKNNHIEIVKLLLTHNGIESFYKNSALILAAKNNYIEITKLLLDYKTDTERVGEIIGTCINPVHINNALVTANGHNHTEIVSLLSSVNGISSLYIALIVAAKNDDINLFKLLLSYHQNDVKPYEKYEILTIAAEHNSTKIVKLLAAHSHLNYKKKALIVAIKNNHIETVKLLLTDDISLFDKDKALKIAAKNNYAEIVKLLLTYNISLHQKKKTLATAIKHNSSEVIKILTD